MPLPDVTSTQFMLFLDWLYFRRLPTRSEAEFDMENCPNCTHFNLNCQDLNDIIWESNKAQTPSEVTSLSDEDDERLEDLIENGQWHEVKLYVLADRCDVPYLRQSLIDAEWSFYDYYAGWQTYARLIYGWRNLLPTSPWNKLATDAFMERWEASDEEECTTEMLLRQKLPHDVVLTFKWSISGLEQGSERGRTVIKRLCAYHEHPQDEDTIEACPGGENEPKLTFAQATRRPVGK